MDELRWGEVDEIVEGLDRPVLAVAFQGLFDASGAATAAIDWLSEHLDTTRLGDIDPETFFDFTQERPVVSFDDDGDRVLTWPSNKVFAVHTPESQRDLVVVSGVEPHLRWRTFSATLAEVAQRTKAETVATLGSMVGMAPHTRSLGVIGSSTNKDLAQRLGLSSPSYQGPTGLVGVLHDTLDQAGIPVLSLRVSLPHYIPDTPNPKATRSLLRRFEQVTGVDTGYVGLDREEADQSEEVVSGDVLAAEFEAFLREQDRNDDQEDQE